MFSDSGRVPFTTRSKTGLSRGRLAAKILDRLVIPPSPPPGSGIGQLARPSALQSFMTCPSSEKMSATRSSHMSMSSGISRRCYEISRCPLSLSIQSIALAGTSTLRVVIAIRSWAVMTNGSESLIKVSNCEPVNPPDLPPK